MSYTNGQFSSGGKCEKFEQGRMHKFDINGIS